MKGKKMNYDQELIQPDPILCLQSQKGKSIDIN